MSVSLPDDWRGEQCNSAAWAVQQVLDAELAIGRVKTRTGGEPGTIVAQFPPPGTSAPSGSQVNLFVSTSRYPKGAFEQCPVVTGTLPLGPGSVHEAEQAALRFARAFLLGDWRRVRGLLDPSALPLRKDHWAVAGKPSRVTVLGPGTSGGTPVAYGCGPKVARRTVAVVLDDGTTSASADFKPVLGPPDGRLEGLGFVLNRASRRSRVLHDAVVQPCPMPRN